MFHAGSSPTSEKVLKQLQEARELLQHHKVPTGNCSLKDEFRHFYMLGVCLCFGFGILNLITCCILRMEFSLVLFLPICFLSGVLSSVHQFD